MVKVGGSKTRRKQGFDEEDPFKAVAVQNVQGGGQSVVTVLGVAIHIALKVFRKPFVQPIPTTTPYFDIKGEVNIHGRTTGCCLFRSSCTRQRTAESSKEKQVTK